MSLTFPASPSTGDTYTAADNTWYWDGTKWRTYGIQGAIGPAGASGTAGNDLPKITTVTYTDSGYTSNSSTSVSTITGGYVKLTGSNFQSGCGVYVNGVAATTTYVSSTQVNVALLSGTAGTYHLYFYNPDGGTTIKVNSIVYQGPPAGSGGTITNSGSYTIHAFTSSGSFTLSSTKSVDILVVAGGGPGGYLYGGGGGGGGLIWQTGQTLAADTYTVTVGAGGTNGGGGTSPANGNSSSFGSVYTALGGGYGAPTSGAGTLYIGGSGGSGGGGAGGGPGAALQPSQSGLNAGFGFAGDIGGGGAGASPIGTNTTTRSQGGVGKLITGFETYGTDASNSTAPTSGKGYFAAGGGGTLVVQSGGSAGGGGYYNAGVSYAGLANTGGGGGGGFPLAAGGSGIVIIRYLT